MTEQQQQPQQMQIPVSAEILFRYLGEAEYRNKVLEQTVLQQNSVIERLKKELDELKNPSKEDKDAKK